MNRQFKPWTAGQAAIYPNAKPTATNTPTWTAPTTQVPGASAAVGITKYYYFASLRVAMRTHADAGQASAGVPLRLGSGQLYLFGDHPSTLLGTSLGSTSASIAPDGSVAEQVQASPQRI